MSYRLRDAWISYDGRRLLSDVSWSADSGTITVIAGPVGTGKSTLLKLLSGRRSPGLTAGGSWCHDGQELAAAWEEGTPPGGIAWVPQIRHAPAGTFRPEQLPEALDRIEMAMACGATTLLLDEPTRGLPPEEVERLASRLAQHAAGGSTIVVVSHDIAFARSVADDICLLFGDRCDTTAPAADFFANPPTAAARDLIAHGVCAPPLPKPPPLPTHLRWFADETIAGMARPGLMGDFDDELFAIASAGVSVVISVIEDPMARSRLRPYGLHGHHVPCKDMGVPSLRDALQGCRVAINAIERGEKVAVHCRAGLGRTGTFVACLLVHLGRTPEEAIEEVRGVNPRYIQSDAQLRFIAEIGEEIAA